MKKRIVSILLIGSLAACAIIYVLFKREIDQFNPLYKSEYVYVTVNKEGNPEGKYIRYRYNLTGYTAQGKEKEITFSASEELRPGTYVKVLAKGAYTKEWAVIQKDEIPDQVKILK